MGDSGIWQSMDADERELQQELDDRADLEREDDLAPGCFGGCLPQGLFVTLGGAAVFAAWALAGCAAPAPDKPAVQQPVNSRPAKETGDGRDAFYRGEELRRKGNLIEALRAYQAASSDPAFADQALKRRQEMAGIRDHLETILDALLITFKHCADRNPALTARRIETARADAERVPDDYRAWCNLGLALMESGRLEDARSAYERGYALIRSLSREPSHAQTYLGRAQCALFLKRYAEAAAVAGEGVSEVPANPHLREKLADALALQGRVDSALESLSAGLRLAPEDLTLRSKRADLQLLLGNYLEARDDYRELIRLNHPQKEIMQLNVQELDDLIRKTYD